MIRRLTLGVMVALTLTACIPQSTEPTSPEQDSGSSSTSIGSTGRVVEVVGCENPPADAEILCEAYELIHSRYVDPVDDRDLAEAADLGLALLDGSSSTSELLCAAPAEEFVQTCNLAVEAAETTAEAAEAMVRGLANFGLDANSAYLDPEALALIEEEQHGEVHGIGALVSAEDRSSGEALQCSVVSVSCRIVIVSALAGSPAEAVGLRPEDVIVGVDGADIGGWTVDEVTARVRGQEGTEVTLTIERDDERFDVVITRAAVTIPVVQSELFDATGYVRLNQFTDNADEQMKDAIFELLTDGVETLVVDLRDNPGGLLTTAIDVASLFLAEGDVVETISPEETRSYEVTGNPIVPAGIEVLFVVNRGSASASELVSAVLQERGRATVVGENTFGKNTVQQRFNLSNGGALKLTVARWVTPGGLDFGGVGVTPDTSVEFEPGMTAEAVVAAAIQAS